MKTGYASGPQTQVAEMAPICSRDFLVTIDVVPNLRPALILVTTARRFSASLTVSDGITQVDGKSLMSLIVMFVKKGSWLKFVAEGHDARALMDAIAQLFAHDFDERCDNIGEPVPGELTAA